MMRFCRAGAILLFLLPIDLAAEIGGEEHFFLSEGQIIHWLPSGRAQKVSVEGRVEALYHKAPFLYYVSRREKGDAPLQLGIINLTRGGTYRQNLSGLGDFTRVRRLEGYGGVAYLLLINPSTPGQSGFLHRLDGNSRKRDSIDGVRDFTLHDDVPCLLQRRGDELFLNRNGNYLTLGLKGDARIKAFLDQRLLLISDELDTEVVDLRSFRSVYIYSEKRKFLPGEEYNLLIEASDENPRKDAEKYLYYKIYVDGQEVGRTKTALSGLPVVFKTRLETEGYHLIFAERWELNRSKNRYERVNNIHQPDPLKILPAANRVLKLIFLYDGKRHRLIREFETE